MSTPADKKLRIVFMGTPAFAVPSLDILVKNGYDIAAVVTAPDKPAGRGQKLKQSAVKEYALQHNIKVLQPVNLKDMQWIEELESLKANLQIVVAFRMLPEAVWKIPELGTFNLHASLLPQYRGAAPINWAVINGEQQTGVTTFFLKHEIDTGNIIHQQHVDISADETAGELHDRLMTVGAALVLKTIHSIEADTVELKEQSALSLGTELKTAPKLSKETARLTAKLTASQAFNLVRGLSPYPAAFAEIVHAESNTILHLKIFHANLLPEEHQQPIGKIETDHKTFLKIYFSAGSLLLTTIQPAGKSKMGVKDFLNGHKLTGNWKLTD